jgi:hypothetical protein
MSGGEWQSQFIHTFCDRACEAIDPPAKRVRLITVKGGLPRDLDLSSREKMHEWFEKSK